jgi:hypothetical protein
MPGPWGAATSKGNTVYVHLLGASSTGQLRLPALPAKIESACLLNGGEVEVKQSSQGVQLAVPMASVDPLDTVVVLTLDRPASEIQPIKTVGESLTIGAEAVASSELSPSKAASSVVASDATEFSEGIFVKSAWSPNRKDENPWIEVRLTEPRLVDQVLIREGKFGSVSSVEAFVLEVERNGEWKTLFEGEQLGGDFSLVLGAPVESDRFRIRFQKWNGAIHLNTFDLFGVELITTQ